MKQIKIIIVFCTLALNFLFGILNCPAQATRIWATYYGGNIEDDGQNVTTDIFGNVYVTGITNSPTDIASGGFQNNFGGGFYNAFLVKFNASGERLWATYYGGSDIFDEDFGLDIATDIAGNVYMSGKTYATAGIASGGFQNNYGGSTDAFLVKFDGANGNRLWASYYGGTGDEYGYGVATDNFGNVYLAGYTNSTNGIASGGFQNTLGAGTGASIDAFLVKFNATTGNRLWATYYGGTFNDYCYDIATDALGNIYLAGNTNSAGIASGGFQNTYTGIPGIGPTDAYLVKFDSNGNRLWATYYGGPANEMYNNAVTADAAGNIYLAGVTLSTTGIASGGFQNSYGGGGFADGDIFLVKFNAAGNRLWATYYGGTAGDEVYSISIGAIGNIFLAGDSYSSSNIASGGFQNSLVGSGVAENPFVAEFDAGGNLLCATYYGDGHNEDGHAAVDISGNVYLTGTTTSPVNIAFGGFQNTYQGNNDAFLVKFCPCSSMLTATTTPTGTYCNGSCTGTGIANVAATYCGNPYTYLWNTIPAQTTQIATGLCEGTYMVTITDALGATVTNTITVTSPLVLSASVISSNLSCNNSGSATVSANGGTGPYTYQWSNSQTNITATGLSAGTYTVIITDYNGCITNATLSIAQYASLTQTTTVTPPVCNGDVGSATVYSNGSNPPYKYLWSNQQTTATASGLLAGTYTVTITDNNDCSTTVLVVIPEPGTISLNTTSHPTACVGKTGIVTATVSAGGNNPYTYSWNTNPEQTTLVVTGLGEGTYTITITDTNGCTQTQAVTIITTTIHPIATAGATKIKITSGDSTQLNVITLSGVEGYQWTPSAGLSCTICPNPIAKPDVKTTYCVEVMDANGCRDSACVIIDIEELCGEIFIPNVFSPNNDGQNEMECVFGNCIQTMSFVIFNRWGEEVFRTTDPKKCWNGVCEGKPMEPSVFVYSFKAISLNGQHIIKNGNISLIR